MIVKQIRQNKTEIIRQTLMCWLRIGLDMWIEQIHVIRISSGIQKVQIKC